MYNAIAMDHGTILLNLFYIYSFQISIIMHNALHSLIYLNIGCITFDATFILMFYIHTCKSNLYIMLRFFCTIKLFCCFRDFLALNVYVALCYYKLDYYDVSQVRQSA